MALWVDDQMAYAASTIAAGNAAIGAWVRMSAWCSSQLSDGVIPVAVARTMASPREIAALNEAGLLVAEGDAVHRIVDYLLLNATRAQVLADRERRRAHAQAAARSRWGMSRADARGDAPSMPDACPEHARPHDRADAPIPSLIPSGDRESAAHAASPPPPRPSRRRPETPVPASSATAEEIAAWCTRWGIPSPTTDREVAAMLDHARTHDRRCRDWAAAWRTWQRRAADYTPRRPPSCGPGGQPVDLDAPWMQDPEPR